MENLAISLFNIAKEIKEDFRVQELGVPEVQTFDNEVLKKALKEKGFLESLMRGFDYAGFSLAFNPSVERKRKEISRVYSPLIIKEADDSLYELFGKDMKKIERDDKNKILGYFILTPVYLNAALDSSFPDFYLHFSLLLEVSNNLGVEFLLDQLKIDFPGRVDILPILYNYEIQFNTFRRHYLARKIREINEKYLRFLPKFFLHSLEEEIDYKNPQKYFESLKLLLPHLKGIGLRFRGKYKGTVFTKSLDEYLSHPLSLSDFLWMFGISNSSQTSIY
jgi:hypothetical protein